MARTDAEFRTKITSTDESTPNVKKAQGAYGKFSSFLKNNFVPVALTATGAVVALGKALSNGIKGTLAAEKALNALETALGRTGDATQKNLKALKAQGDALQQNTKFTADSVTATQAFLANLGVSADQLGLATQASVDLAEAFGISLEQAARNVGKTVGGFAGELGELIPELKNLDAEALKSGKGIELLAEKFAGTAAQSAKTLGGELKQVGNELDDLTKVFIQTILGADKLGQEVGDLSGAIKKLEPFVKGIANIFLVLLKVIENTATEVRFLIGIFSSYTPEIVKVVDAQGDLGKALEKNVKNLRETNTAAQFQREVMALLAEGTKGAADANTNLADSTEAVIEKQDEQKEKIEGSTEALVEYTDAYESVELQLARATLGTDEHTRALIENTAAARDNAAASGATSSGFGGTLTGGSELFPDSDIANTPITIITDASGKTTVVRR